MCREARTADTLVSVKLERTFPRVLFGPKAIEDAFAEYCAVTGSTPVEEIVDVPASQTNEAEMTYMSVKRGNSDWRFDNRHEFLADLASPFSLAYVDFKMRPEGKNGAQRGPLKIEIRVFDGWSVVRVFDADRATITRLMRVFDLAAPDYTMAPPPVPAPAPVEPPNIFIGHGRSDLWKDLKNHLTDHQGYKVVAYETGSRSGHTIRDVLENMLDASSFAIVVMTGEDEQDDGSLRARQNVVHEAGLFQGRLGFPRVAILMEAGVDAFSNIDGVQYIPFSTGNIRETYGDVLAVLRREFPS